MSNVNNTEKKLVTRAISYGGKHDAAVHEAVITCISTVQASRDTRQSNRLIDDFRARGDQNGAELLCKLFAAYGAFRVKYHKGTDGKADKSTCHIVVLGEGVKGYAEAWRPEALRADLEVDKRVTWRSLARTLGKKVEHKAPTLLSRCNKLAEAVDEAGYPAHIVTMLQKAARAIEKTDKARASAENAAAEQAVNDATANNSAE